MNLEPRRNEPCPCGSGKRYKKCCGLDAPAASQPAPQPTAAGLPNSTAKGDAPTAVEKEQAIALFNAGRHGELESLARTLIQQYPVSGFAWKVLGISLQLQGKEALVALQKTAQFLPDDAGAHGNLGRSSTGAISKRQRQVAAGRWPLTLITPKRIAIWALLCKVSISLKEPGRAAAGRSRSIPISPRRTALSVCPCEPRDFSMMRS